MATWNSSVKANREGAAEVNMEATSPNLGEVVSVRGSVVDVRFGTRLPPIYTLLRAGKDGPTQGLARGMVVEDAGGPLLAPVGHAILGRMFDVFGNAIDCEPVPSGLQWRSVHQAPPPLATRSTKSEAFETGIKIIDVLAPLERGGSAGLFGGRWQDRAFN